MADDVTMKMATKVIHAGQRPEPVTGAVMPPVFFSSTYAQESPGKHKGFEYSRSHNPTRYALERMIAKLEGSEVTEEQDPSCGGFAFASGLASIGTTLELLNTGDHVVAMDDLYGGTNRLFRRVRERSQGLRFSFADMSDPAEVEKALKPETKMVWVETPTNPTLKLADLKAIAKLARKVCPEAILVCDNTFASPVNQRPLELGFDMVMHSSTKYINGHSDVIGGLLVCKTPELAERIRFLQNAVGGVMGPMDAYLTLRGCKTLHVRMARHNASAMRIAKWLDRHDMVDRAVYPALPSHPQHELFTKQVAKDAPDGGGGGMITFFIRGGLEASRKFLEAVRVFACAESLGGVESLIEHPAIMTHASVPKEMRDTLGISDSLIRLSVGVEDADDLIADLERAFDAAER